MLSVVADVGGTNIRLAVCCNETGKLTQIRFFSCAQFLTLEAALFQYFITLPDPVSCLCIAIACPVDDDIVNMTNLNWQFSQQALKTKLSLDTLFVINDYTAIALSLPYLSPQDKIKIGQGEAKANGVCAVFGPGTGLGVAHVIHHQDKWLSLDGEGGHVSFAANTQEQTDILLLLQAQFGHVSAERLLSGQGLINIYHAICRLEGKQVQFYEPKDVSEAAMLNTCHLAQRSLCVFCEIMGSFAGNLALTLSCTGGVYIAGGIVPRFVDYFMESKFRQSFEQKGRFNQYLSTVPTYLITHEHPGLLGAAVHLRQATGVIQY